MEEVYYKALVKAPPRALQTFYETGTIDAVLHSARDLKAFLTRPVDCRAPVVQCGIRREKAGHHNVYPRFTLFMTGAHGEERILMTAKKRPNGRKSNYWICMEDCMHSDEDDVDRFSPLFLGKLSSNVGNDYALYRNDVDEHVPVLGDRQDLLAVRYVPSIGSGRGPRRIQLYGPRVDADGEHEAWYGPRGKEPILNAVKQRKFHDLVHLVNKPPVWNEYTQNYVLNFNGRVTIPSVKNFQLCFPDAPENVVLQFGRIGKNEFTLDLQYPLSPLQAFAAALSAMDLNKPFE